MVWHYSHGLFGECCKYPVVFPLNIYIYWIHWWGKLHQYVNIEYVIQRTYIFKTNKSINKINYYLILVLLWSNCPLAFKITRCRHLHSNIEQSNLFPGIAISYFQLVHIFGLVGRGAVSFHGSGSLCCHPYKFYTHLYT